MTHNHEAQREEKRTNDALAPDDASEDNRRRASRAVQASRVSEYNLRASERRLVTIEEEKRQSKRLRKQSRPMDHREEGGEG